MGGWDGVNELSDVEVFPPPSPSDKCSIPDLPAPRRYHSLSLLSEGRLVVCGGSPHSIAKSCISWIKGNTSWTTFHTMRSWYYIVYINKELNQQDKKTFPCELDTAIPSFLHRPSWWIRRSSDHYCRDCARSWELIMFSHSLLQVEKPFICVTMETKPAGFLMKIQLWWLAAMTMIMSQGRWSSTVYEANGDM